MSDTTPRKSARDIIIAMAEKQRAERAARGEPEPVPGEAFKLAVENSFKGLAFEKFLLILQYKKAIGDMNQVIGLEESFLTDILAEPDDWTFILKWTAYIEAILVRVITEKLGYDLANVLASMPLADKSTSKIRLARVIGVIEDDDFKFVEHLARVRNQYAHRITNARLTFAELYLQELKGDFSLKHFLGQKNGIEKEIDNFRNHFDARATHFLNNTVWFLKAAQQETLIRVEMRKLYDEAEAYYIEQKPK